MSGVSFSGDVADYYVDFRRGFADPALSFVADRLAVGPEDLVVDLGCGTGQLALPLASRVRHVLGIDPESDMLAHARRAAHTQGMHAATSWMLGSDADVPSLIHLLGPAAVGAVTISNAIHLMDSTELFHRLRGVLAPGGSVAVIANGSPIWLQGSAWSRALREFLQHRFEISTSSACGTDEATRHRYREELAAEGFVTDDQHVDVSEPVSFDWIVGNVLSSIPASWLPSHEERPGFARDLRAALRSAQPDGGFVEDVRLAVLVGYCS